MSKLASDRIVIILISVFFMGAPSARGKAAVSIFARLVDGVEFFGVTLEEYGAAPLPRSGMARHPGRVESRHGN